MQKTLPIFGHVLILLRFTALFPNNDSAKLIIQARIAHVYYYADRVCSP